ncbi:hypothetical protein BJF79_43515 [Actinomadura sp. CNU-125]|uniref:AAA family ATPase n=1 Tax=Actinomadura sp. CNU-125 TaxID=1904961 RepID=UPI000961A82B|nr:AAA family ATPase [Actinomadura sp. CNU-125]OLT26412.1 hypothetical protein BJF79_43515 [Actinomadura sp. CNU-125]
MTENGGVDPDALAGRFAQMFAALAGNIERVVRGKRDRVELALTCLLAEGHLLVEDVPGVGKTTLARAISASVEAEWTRIQFTPDLLPSDITGVSIFNQGNNAFEFHPGPIFANIAVADEINRGSPKTQSALLEVMEERRVTVEGRPHPVPRPFMVVATQNPVDMDGTYPLPEAQLDRFLMRISIGYPDHRAEVAMLAGAPTGAMLDRLPAVMGRDDLARMIDFARRLHVAPPLHDYVVRVVAAPALPNGTGPHRMPPNGTGPHRMPNGTGPLPPVPDVPQPPRHRAVLGAGAGPSCSWSWWPGCCCCAPATRPARPRAGRPGRPRRSSPPARSSRARPPGACARTRCRPRSPSRTRS